MRVSEFAKELGRSNKEILDILAAQGVEGKTHSSNISAEEASAVRAKLAAARPAAPPREQAVSRAPERGAAPVGGNVAASGQGSGSGAAGQRPAGGMAAGQNQPGGASPAAAQRPAGAATAGQSGGSAPATGQRLASGSAASQSSAGGAAAGQSQPSGATSAAGQRPAGAATVGQSGGSAPATGQRSASGSAASQSLAGGTAAGQSQPGGATSAAGQRPAGGTAAGQSQPGGATPAAAQRPASGMAVGQNQPGGASPAAAQRPASGTAAGQSQPGGAAAGQGAAPGTSPRRPSASAADGAPAPKKKLIAVYRPQNSETMKNARPGQGRRDGSRPQGQSPLRPQGQGQMGLRPQQGQGLRPQGQGQSGLRPQGQQAGRPGQPIRPQGASAGQSPLRPQGMPAGQSAPRPQGASAGQSVPRPQGMPAGQSAPRPQGASAGQSVPRPQGMPAGQSAPRPQGVSAGQPGADQTAANRQVPSPAASASQAAPQPTRPGSPLGEPAAASAAAGQEMRGAAYPQAPSSQSGGAQPLAGASYPEGTAQETSVPSSASASSSGSVRENARPQGQQASAGADNARLQGQGAGGRVQQASGGPVRDGSRGQGGFGTRDGSRAQSGQSVRDGSRGQGGPGVRDGNRGQGGFGGRDGARGQGSFGTRDGSRGQGSFGTRDGSRGQGSYGARDGSRGQGSYGARDGSRGQGGFGTRDGSRGQGGFGARDGSRGQGGFGARDGSRGQGGYGTRDGSRTQGSFGARDGSRGQGGFGTRDGARGQGGFGTRDGSRGQGGFGARDGVGRSQSGRPGARDGGKSFDTQLAAKPQSGRGQKNAHKNDRYDNKKSMNEDGPRAKGKSTTNKHPFIMPQKPEEAKVEDSIKVITIPESLTIKELADKMKLQPSAIVKKLFMKGTVVTLNQEIDYEQAEEIAMEYDVLCEKEEKEDVIANLLHEDEEREEDMVTRPPVVCVMGHVDHGKTSLLDAIRQTNVTSHEAGGITQHIGAYVVEIRGQKITFLDTPGHEAFTAMRMRGAQSTDIAVLVVAADDGVMPQTVEAINHAKAAGVEIIVAVNKIDKPNANVERVKQEMTEYDLVPEDWGGSTIFVPVSAHTKEGIPELLEMILLTAEVKELKANPNRNARGLVIEAQLDKGKGPVATMLVQKGTLRVGDNVAVGACYGKVRAMMDDKGRRVKEAPPSTPVEILGLNGVPGAGEIFVSCDSEKEARSFAETFISEGKSKLIEDTKAKLSLDDLFSQIQAGNVKELPIIVKADVQGSVEAVTQSLTKLSNEEVVVKVIHGGVGAINESDVTLASASNAIIIGFNVRPDATARSIADQEKVDIRLYRVIYQAIEDVEAAMKGMLDPVFEEQVIGHAVVRQTFRASGVGTIAGSYVLDGKLQRGCSVRVTRNGAKLYEGPLASLKRFKDDVKEVAAGYECGLSLERFNDIQEDDTIEAYAMVEVPR